MLLVKSFIYLVVGFLALGLAALTPRPADAAGVSAQTGEVFLDAGDGFFSVKTPTYAATGTTLMVPEKATAYLSFSAACSTTVVGPKTVQIPADPPCAPGQTQPDPGWQQAGSANTGTTPSGVSNVPSETLVIGGLVIGGGVAAALALTGGGSDDGGKPASP